MATIHSAIISRAGASTILLPLLSGKTRILLVIDQNVGALGATRAIRRLLAAEGRRAKVIDTVPAEPSHHDVTQIISQLGASQSQIIVGIGRGDMLNVARLFSALLHLKAPSLTVPSADGLPQRRVSSLLIPVTAGTGSGATPSAILAIPRQQTKVGIISPVLLPDYVALLPKLTTSMPASITVSIGTDAPCHLLECFTSTVANPVNDNVALIGLRKLVRHIERSVDRSQDLTAKLKMPWTSWYGGTVTNHAGTCLVHTLSYPLGGTWHLPHGAANAILLALCMRVVRLYVVTKFAQVRDLIPGTDRTLSEEERSHALAAWPATLVKRLLLPGNLTTLSVPRESIPILSAATQDIKCLVNNTSCGASRERIAAIYQMLFPEHA